MEITLTKAQIPKHLYGDLYQTLSSNESFQINQELFEETIIIINIKDLYKYIKILDYWGVNQIPKEIGEWIAQNKIWDEIFTDEFYFWLFIHKEELRQFYSLEFVYDGVSSIVYSNDDDLCSRMAQFGYHNALRCAHSAKYLWNKDIINISIINGNLECLKFVIENGCHNIFDQIEFKKIINTISQNGHVSVLKYVYENMHLFNVYVDEKYYEIFVNEDEEEDYDEYFEFEKMEKQRMNDLNYWNGVTFHASLNGHTSILNFAYSKGLLILISKNCIINGHLEYLTLACNYGYRPNSDIILDCLQDETKIKSIIKNFEIVKYLHNKGCILPTKLAFESLSIDIEVFRFLCSNALFSPDTLSKLYIEAVKRNSLEAIKIIYDSKKVFTHGIYHASARKGNLDIIKFLFSQGCVWDKNTCEGAVENGHLSVLVFAHENGCPWDFSVCNMAIANGHFECLVYAHENGCPWNASAYKYAKRKHRENFMDYLRKNGCK